MQRVRWVCLALLLIMTWGLAGIRVHGQAPKAQEEKVNLRVLGYNELGKLIRSYKGKVVIVDFWAESCLSCKIKGLPHLVQLRKKYPKDKLAIVTVCLLESDELKPNEEFQAVVKGTLRRKKANALVNVLLDAKPGFWTRKLGIESFPVIFVFDQQNRWVQKDETGKYDKQVDPVVERLLKK